MYEGYDNRHFTEPSLWVHDIKTVTTLMSYQYTAFGLRSNWKVARRRRGEWLLEMLGRFVRVADFLFVTQLMELAQQRRLAWGRKRARACPQLQWCKLLSGRLSVIREYAAEVLELAAEQLAPL